MSAARPAPRRSSRAPACSDARHLEPGCRYPGAKTLQRSMPWHHSASAAAPVPCHGHHVRRQSGVGFSIIGSCNACLTRNPWSGYHPLGAWKDAWKTWWYHAEQPDHDLGLPCPAPVFTPWTIRRLHRASGKPTGHVLGRTLGLCVQLHKPYSSSTVELSPL